MSSQGSRKRKAPVPQECANPVFEQWIIEWQDDAATKNSKLQYVYSKALQSLRRFPLTLNTGKDCQILENFGPGICTMIDKRLAKEPHLVKGPASSVQEILNLEELPGTKKAKKSKSKSPTKSSSQQSDDGPRPSKSKAPSKRRYIPAYRSGSYALLVIMFQKESTPNYRGYMLKTELVQEAQDHCEASMTTAKSGYATAWNGMATLVSKALVIKRGNPVKYLLSVEGRELAALLVNAGNGIGSSTTSRQETLSDDDSDLEIEIPREKLGSRTRLDPHTFEIILCVDTSEQNTKLKKDEVMTELRKNGVPLEVIRLNVGDFVWICRKTQRAMSSHRLTISRSDDMVLPYVVERKRHDDLASSIRDGRFHEQKNRLDKTGLQPIYLVESYGSGDHGLADGALMQAVANTQIIERYIVQETDSLKDTCAYLTHMTRHLTRKYTGKTVSSCTKEEWPTHKDKTDATYLMSFSDFNEFSTKSRNWTVSEMFGCHLMKIRGLSQEKARAILEKYPTLADLLAVYRQCSNDVDRYSILMHLRYGFGSRHVGPSLSKALTWLYTREKFET